MASLPKDPNSDYYRVIFRKTYDGKQRSKTFYFRKDSYTRTEVRDWKRAKEMDFKGGDWMPWDKESRIKKESALTLQQAIDKYKKIAQQQLAEETIRTRFSDLKLFAEYIGKARHIKNITSENCNSFINRSGTYGTKKRRKSSLKNFFEYLDREPDLNVLATRAEKKKNKSTYKTYLKSSEFDAVKQAAETIHETNKNSKAGKSPKFKKYREFEKEFPYIFDFLINTALRRGDLLNLNTAWFSVDYHYMTIGDDSYLPKSQQVERIPLTHDARIIAKRWVEKYGQPCQPFINITKDWYTTFFKKVFEEALPRKAPKLSAHKMRDSAVMYLLHELNLSPQTVQQITRHKQLKTLMVYAHRSPEAALREIENKGG